MTSWGYIGLGVFTATLGFILLASAGFDLTGNVAVISLAGLLLAIVGGVMLTIGVIAEGVRVGTTTASRAAEPRTQAHATPSAGQRP